MAETYNDINLKSLVFNKVTNEEYRQMVQNGTIKDDEFYITPSELIDVPNIDSTTSGKYLSNDGTGALWSDVKSTNVVQDLSNPSADTVLSSQGVANESSRIMSIMDTKQDKSTAVNYNNISNCITEIPQDIKFELNNGTLTLKAGSKVYVPNGFEADGTTLKFDVVTIENDITTGRGWSNLTGMFFLTPSKKNVIFTGNLQITSGTSATISDGNIWYDTSTNLIKRCNDSSTWTDGHSLPICIATSDNSNPNGTSGIASIDQVFNGFGYIGSTIFVLPGVKGLIPNGRNADGSLKSIEINSNVVKTYTESDSGNRILMLGSSGVSNFITAIYDEEKNILYNSSNSQINSLICGTFTREDNGVITSFTHKTVFHAVDYNDFTSRHQLVSVRPVNPDPNTFYYIPEE